MPPPYSSRLWRLYDAALDPVNRTTPCRQSFHWGAFVRLMLDPRVIKLTCGRDGEHGFAAVTRHFELLPWISESYFEDLIRRTGRPFAYVPILVIPPNGRGTRAAPALLQAVRRTCATLWGVHDLGFDVCTANGALPMLMQRVLGSTARIEPLGAQRYFCASEEAGTRSAPAEGLSGDTTTDEGSARQQPNSKRAIRDLGAVATVSVSSRVVIDASVTISPKGQLHGAN